VTPHIHPLEIGFGFEKLAKEGIHLNIIRDNRVFLKVTLSSPCLWVSFHLLSLFE
jgi:hypothetical protein